jgi:hypothetical protein
MRRYRHGSSRADDRADRAGVSGCRALRRSLAATSPLRGGRNTPSGMTASTPSRRDVDRREAPFGISRKGGATRRPSPGAGSVDNGTAGSTAHRRSGGPAAPRCSTRSTPTPSDDLMDPTRGAFPRMQAVEVVPPSTCSPPGTEDLDRPHGEIDEPGPARWRRAVHRSPGTARTSGQLRHARAARCPAGEVASNSTPSVLLGEIVAARRSCARDSTLRGRAGHRSADLGASPDAHPPPRADSASRPRIPTWCSGEARPGPRCARWAGPDWPRPHRLDLCCGRRPTSGGFPNGPVRATRRHAHVVLPDGGRACRRVGRGPFTASACGGIVVGVSADGAQAAPRRR